MQLEDVLHAGEHLDVDVETGSPSPSGQATGVVEQDLVAPHLYVERWEIVEVSVERRDAWITWVGSVEVQRGVLV